MGILFLWREALILSLAVALITYFLQKSSPSGRKKRLLRSAFYAYGIILFILTALPIIVTSNELSWQDIWYAIIKQPIRPLLTSASIGLHHLQEGLPMPFLRFLVNTLGNFLLLVPFAVFLKILFDKSYPKIILYGSLLSLGIETMQAILNKLTGQHTRVVDINDFILNLSGILCCSLIMFLISKKKRTRQQVASSE